MRKSALIVDDSKSARVVLSRMLEVHDLDVATVESAESALEYLNDHRPDVIFMDHLMPGMDGFEAVTAIKNNPDTATIPIMMYTSQKGEVYVGQARALGAVGVLPKEVEPVEVSKVLESLRVIGHRAVREVAAMESGREEAGGEIPGLEKFDHDLRELIQDLFDQQRAVIRRDLLDSYEAIATRVADEIRVQPSEEEKESQDRAGQNVPTAVRIAIALMAVVIAVFGWLYWQSEQSWQQERQQTATLLAALEQQRTFEADGTIEVQRRLSNYQQSYSSTFLAALNAMEWAVNLAAPYPFGEIPLGDRRLAMVEELNERLLGMGYSGQVLLETHVGDFCTMVSPDDGLVPAPASTEARDCERIGLGSDDALAFASRQSVAFANFLNIIEEQTAGQIRYVVTARGNAAPVIDYPPLIAGVTAGEWNDVALANNRVEITLEPDGF
ncbi:MAG TPA: response regulator [Woeseiaceae bacterium]